ncbi:uncharacterized protein LOC143909914 [Arctopsyche grandis]|uniref:uncharacterized protein LOC143909914 n=1 Tax=Arctopsyche grandis TaxID=121162 RepID=UPI00406D94C0
MSSVELCRLCGEPGKATEPLTALLRRQINQCFGISIETTDELPQTLCFKCQVIVSEFHSVMIKYQNKQISLFNQFKNKETCKDAIKSSENLDIKLEPSENLIPSSENKVVDKNVDEPMEIDDVKVSNSSPENLIENSLSFDGLNTIDLPEEKDAPKVNQNIERNQIIHVSDKIEDTILNSRSNQNTFNSNDNVDKSTLVPVWRVKYNCTICNESFVSKNQSRNHKKNMHKNIVDICDRLCTKICLVALKKLPINLPNKAGYSLSPSWIHLGKNKIQKLDLKLNHCYLSKIRQEIAKCLTNNLDSAVEKELDKSLNTLSSVKNVIDLTVENVAIHNRILKKTDNENESTTITGFKSDRISSPILNQKDILDIEKANIVKLDEQLNISTSNKDPANNCDDIADNTYALEPNEIYKTVAKCFSECSVKKGDFNTKFLNRIKLRSIGVLWLMNESSPFKLYFSKSTDLQKHTLKHNGLCATMIGLKPYTNKIQNQVPISQTMLNVRYFKMSEEEKATMKPNTKEPQIPSQTIISSKSIDPFSMNSSSMTSKQTPESYNSPITESNVTMPKIISTYSLTPNGEEKRSNIPNENIQHKPMIKCKPTALLMANSNQSAASNGFLGIPNFVKPPNEKSTLTKNFQDQYEKNVILNYQYNQNNTPESSAKRFKVIKKYDNKESEKSIFESTPSAEMNQPFNVNEDVNRLPTVLLDINRNSGIDMFSKISKPPSNNSNNPNSRTFVENDNLVDFEKVISSPVLFKNIDSQPVQNNLSSSLVPAIFVSMPETSIADNSSTNSLNMFSNSSTNNSTMPVNNMNLSCISSLKSGSGMMTISHNNENEHLPNLMPVSNDFNNLYQYQLFNPNNRQSQNVTESPQQMSQPPVFINPSSFFISQPSQFVTKPSQFVTQPSQFVTQPSQLVNQPYQSVTQPSQSVIQSSHIVTQPFPQTKPSQPVQKASPIIIKPSQIISKSPQFMVKPPQIIPQLVQPVTRTPQLEISTPQLETESQLKTRLIEQSDGINGPFFQLVKAIKDKGVVLCTHTDDKSVRSLVRFKILINEMYKDSNLSKTFHVKLSLLQNGTFLLNVTNAELLPENVNEWSSQYQSQLIRAFQQKTVLNTISIMASSNPFNMEGKTQKFLQTLADFDFSSCK